MYPSILFEKKILISEQIIFECWDFLKILFQPFQICDKNVKEKKMLQFEIFFSILRF